MKLLVATKNKHKLREIAEILGKNIDVVSAFDELKIDDDIEETGNTFEDNACIKAKYISKFTDEYVIADDSGLEVFALNKKPGVYSARFAGEDATDEDNNKKLLKELKNIENRQAQYVCVIALAKKENIIKCFEGTLSGEIAISPSGNNGFGYDPLFKLENGKTVAEMSAIEKNKISHRREALNKLKEFLDKLKLRCKGE